MKKEDDILEIDLDELEDVAILDGNGVLRAGYKLVDPKTDSSGLIRIVSLEEKMSRVHPSRVVKSNECSSISTEYDGKKIASCPECGAIVTITGDSNTAVCGDCDKEFSIFVEGINVQGDPVSISNNKRKTSKTSKKQKVDVVDINELASKGELWIRRDVPFDDPNTDVIAASLRIGDFYISFNLYNMSFGKNGNKPPIDELEAGIDPNNRPTGVYAIKNIDKWHKKLENKGYLKHE